ncbi:MAG TPA: hypothetical protein VGH42_03160, partial [Verrucomicrobiae bacterium]
VQLQMLSKFTRNSAFAMAVFFSISLIIFLALNFQSEGGRLDSSTMDSIVNVFGVLCFFVGLISSSIVAAHRTELKTNDSKLINKLFFIGCIIAIFSGVTFLSYNFWRFLTP